MLVISSPKVEDLLLAKDAQENVLIVSTGNSNGSKNVLSLVLSQFLRTNLSPKQLQQFGDRTLVDTLGFLLLRFSVPSQ